MKPFLALMAAVPCLAVPALAHAGLHVSMPQGRHHHHHLHGDRAPAPGDAAPPAPAAPAAPAPEGW